MMESEETDWHAMRFGGNARLYGAGSLGRLRAARVLVVGIGGVGTWVVEALARGGIGKIGLMDMDDVCVTNTNRQIHALHDTIGMPKTGAMAARARAINPEVEMVEISAFFGTGTADVIRPDAWDMVVDAIDAVAAKSLLLATCRQRGIPVVACGGAGGKRDGTRVRVDDLARTVQDPLLRQVRKTLRREHGFPQGENQEFGIPAVFSSERPAFPWADGSVCAQPEPGASLRLDCASGFGTAAHVTGAFGLAAAGVVMAWLAAPAG